MKRGEVGEWGTEVMRASGGNVREIGVEKEEKEGILGRIKQRNVLSDDRCYSLSSLCMLMRGPRPTTTPPG